MRAASGLFAALLVACWSGATALSLGAAALRVRTARPAVTIAACVGEAAAAPALLEEFCLLCGPVSSGYGRGSKQIGVPTANLPTSTLGADGVELLGRGGGGARPGTLDALPRGAYVAWAGLRGEVHPAVVNVGLSPTFEEAQNPEPIAEAHLLQTIDTDFYGEQLTLLLLGFVRPERKFPSFDELIGAIRSDIATAGSALELPEYAECAELARFRERVGAAPVATAAAEDEDDGFSFMAPPEGLDCEGEEECVIPFDDDDEDE